MKRIIFVLLIVSMVAFSALAVDFMSYPPPVDGGDLLLNAGVGFGGFGQPGSTVRIPPIVGALEYCLPLGVPVSVGGVVSFYQYGWTSEFWSYVHTYFTLAGRANWHWNIDVEWLDLYSGISIGYTNHSYSSKGPSGQDDPRPNLNYGGLYWAGQVGARFYFVETIGAFAEIGHPMWLQMGITFKF